MEIQFEQKYDDVHAAFNRAARADGKVAVVVVRTVVGACCLNCRCKEQRDCCSDAPASEIYYGYVPRSFLPTKDGSVVTRGDEYNASCAVVQWRVRGGFCEGASDLSETTSSSGFLAGYADDVPLIFQSLAMHSGWRAPKYLSRTQPPHFCNPVVVQFSVDERTCMLGFD